MSRTYGDETTRDTSMRDAAITHERALWLWFREERLDAHVLAGIGDAISVNRISEGIAHNA
jgi:hypothetical protein